MMIVTNLLNSHVNNAGLEPNDQTVFIRKLVLKVVSVTAHMAPVAVAR